MGNQSELRVHDITYSYRHIYNLKEQKQSFERLLLFISLHMVNSVDVINQLLPVSCQVVLTFCQLIGQPVQPLVQTSTLSGTGGLGMPLRRQT